MAFSFARIFFSLSLNSLLFSLLLISCFPSISSSLSTVAIAETPSNKTLVCALLDTPNHQSSLNCTSFPEGIHSPINPPVRSYSAIVGGNGFLCALITSYSSNVSTLVCWRFSGSPLQRVYQGTAVEDLDSGNSHICGLISGSYGTSDDLHLQCWQWKGFNSNFKNASFASSIAVGENFVCWLESNQIKCSGSYSPVTDHVPNGGNYRLVAAGFRHACAVSFNGSLECWGVGAGQKLNGEFKSLALGENRSCGLRPNGTVTCWGEGGFHLPAALSETQFFSLKANRKVFCGISLSNFSLYCWGNEILNSNPRVFNDVVPGPCRNQCPCTSLPDYSKYCSQGQRICQPCQMKDQQKEPQPSSPPVSPPSQPAAPPPSHHRTSSGGSSPKWSRRNVALLAVGCIGSSSLALVSFLLFFKYCKIRGSRIHDSGRLDDAESPPPEHAPEPPRPQEAGPAAVLEKRLSQLVSIGNNGNRLEEFSLQVLLEATDSFSEEHKIGTGSFGSVYRATLDEGREIAIKRAEISASSSYAGAKDKDSAFLNELEFLSRLNHKNLVKLLGYCEDCNEKVLIFEYMKNGTLHDHLHKLDASPLISWPARIKVALDAARGIEYLHEYAVPPIIHRDIKSSNILLDATWTAKVSDFGLSLMGPQEDESHLSLLAAGTVGYMDPEYYRLQLLTTKSDVYSFGVVLLEILSGKKAIHPNENGTPRNVIDYMAPYVVQDEIHRVLDRRVPPPTPFEIEAVAYVGYLAVDCVKPEGRCRPTMTDVVQSLERALAACLASPNLSRSTTSSSA